MKTNKIIWIMFLVLILRVPVLPVSAATETRDGLEITLTTDSGVYAPNEEIVATITVKNTNDIAVTDVSLELCTVPEGYEIADVNETKIESLAAGETVELEVTLSPKEEDTSTTPSEGEDSDITPSEGEDSDTTPSEGEDSDTIPDEGEDSGTTTGEEEGKTTASENGNDEATPVTVSAQASTGDGNHILLWGALCAFAGIAVLCLCIYKKKQHKKLLSVLLCTALLPAILLLNKYDVLAAEQVVSILDFNDEAAVNSVDVVTGDWTAASTENTQNGNAYSIHWNNQVERTRLSLYKYETNPADWSEYEYIEMWIYSAKATNAKIKVLAMSSDASESAWHYFASNISVNWEGWKCVKINLNDMAQTRTPSWSSIKEFRLVSAGWSDLTPSSETDIYIATANLGKTVPDEVPDDNLLDFNDENAVNSVGTWTAASTDYTRNDNTYSIHWNNQENNKVVCLHKDVANPADWSEYEYIEMWIYSVKATNAAIKVIALSTDSAAGGWQYFHRDVTVDWEGWKCVKINLNDMAKTGTPSWSNITELRLASTGWNLIPSSETDIYIATANLGKSADPYDFVSSFYSTEVINETYELLKGNAAVYAGGSNVATGEGAIEAGYSFGWKDSTVTVPVKFFYEYFGAEVTDDGSTYSIKLNGNTVSGRAGEATVTVNGSEVSVNPAAQTIDSMTYVPGAVIAELLGLKCETDNKLLVIGTTDTVEEFGRNESLGVNEKGEIAAYLSYHDKVNVEITSDDFEAAKKNWIRSLVGDETTNDVNDSDIKAKIDSITATARSSWEKLIKDENASEIFSGIVSNGTGGMTSAYLEVYRMACGYACYGGELYQNADLFSDIIYALNWLKANRYNTDNYNKTASANWQITAFNNWFDWAIGTPIYLIPTLMMIEDEITDVQIEEYLAFFDEHVPLPRMTGSNFTDMAIEVIGSALLQEDSARIYEVQTMMTKNFLYVDDNKRFAESQLGADRKEYTPIKGMGFFTDGSYILHTLHPYNGNYGNRHFEALVDFMAVFADTGFELKIPFVDNVVQIYKDGFDSVIYDSKLFRWTRGRYPGEVTANRFVEHADIFRVAASFDSETENEIYQILKEIGQDHYQGLVSAMPLESIKSFKAMMSDDSVTAKVSEDSNKVFYNTDKVVQKTDTWGAAISMSSSRIFNYESISDLNMDGWYLSDGRTEYYLKGSNVNSTPGYWTSVDKYRLPGTTVDTQERVKTSITEGNEYLSSKDFVGGVTLGDYGVAAMELESYHNETDYGVGTYLAPAHQSDLTAKKAYFMFDDEIVCLGTAVNAQNNNDAEVLTIVENLSATKTMGYSEVVTEITNQTNITEEVTVGDVKVNIGGAVTYTINTITVQPADAVSPYTIISATANITPQEDNPAEASIDDSYDTKYAANENCEIVWDIGSVQELGFIDLSFMSGSKRKQYFKLEVSADGDVWTEVFDGESSGTKERNEYFDLKSSDARYVKLINLGNSTGSAWASITNCAIYPPNADGSIGIAETATCGADVIMADGEKIELYGEDYLLNDVTWVNAAGTCGYVFPKEKTENMGSLKARWTNADASYFELWFSHGVNPTNGGYAYILLPGQSADETAAYASDTRISILENNESIQAVKDTTLGITGIIFWEAGTYGDITVSAPCMVVYRESNDGLEIAVSDPTQKLNSLTVTVNKALIAYDMDDCIEVESSDSSTVIQCDMTDSVGRSMETNFNYR